MDSDSSESEDEVNDLMREAANCDYVNNLYNNSYIEECKKNKTSRKTEDQEESTVTSHQVFLSKTLSKKLDSLIKIVEIDDIPAEQRISKEASKGIQLLKNSILIDEPEVEEIVQKKVSSKIDDISDKERTLRAKEAAVTPEWVLSTSNTAFWKFYKPKIIYATADESSNGKVTCSIVNKTFGK